MVKIDKTKTVAENVIEVFRKLRLHRRVFKEWESELLELARQETSMYVKRDERTFEVMVVLKVRQLFLKAIKGYTVSQVVQVVDKWHIGVTWKGCSKESLAESYVQGKYGSGFPESVLASKSLEDLRDELEQRFGKR